MPPTTQNDDSISSNVRLARWIAQFPALTVTVLLRRNIGYQLLNPIPLFIMFAILASLSSDQTAAFHARDLFYFGLTMLAAGLHQRIERWRDIDNGIPHHSCFIGISRLESLNLPNWFRRNDRVKRFLDPAVCILVGFVVAHLGRRVLGSWLVLSGFCLRTCEYTVFRNAFRRKLEMGDALIESEVHQGYMQEFEDSPDAQQQQQSPGIPTGLGDDITEKIKQQKDKARNV